MVDHTGIKQRSMLAGANKNKGEDTAPEHGRNPKRSKSPIREKREGGGGRDEEGKQGKKYTKAVQETITVTVQMLDSSCVIFALGGTKKTEDDDALIVPTTVQDAKDEAATKCGVLAICQQWVYR